MSMTREKWQWKLLGLAVAFATSLFANGSPKLTRKLVSRIAATDGSATILVYGLFEYEPPKSTFRACYRSSVAVARLPLDRELSELLARANDDAAFTQFTFFVEPHPRFPHRGFRSARFEAGNDGGLRLHLTPVDDWSKTMEIPYCTAEDLELSPPDNVLMPISSPGWVCGPESRGKDPTLEVYQRSFTHFGALLYTLHEDIVGSEVAFDGLQVDATGDRQQIRGRTGATSVTLEVDLTHSTPAPYGELKFPARLTLVQKGKTLLDRADYHCLNH